MKIFGHPIHLMLIHFPSALLPMELVCYSLFYFYALDSFATAAYYSMAGGVGLGWLAVVFGILDLSVIPMEKQEALKKGLWHGGINTIVLIFYTILVVKIYKNYPEMPLPTLTMMVTKAIFIILLFGGNYLGGSLILKYKVAVEK